MKHLLALLLLLAPLPAQAADWFDYILQFTSEAVAISDATGTQYRVPASNGFPAQWQTDIVVPGVKVCKGATCQTGWWAVVSSYGRLPLLDNFSGTQVIIDRDIARLGLPYTSFVVFSKNPIASLSGYCVSPVPAGSPWSCAVP